MMDSLHGIIFFVRVVEAMSFTEAARRIGISPSGVSKSVTRLEEKLGVRLLDRTTRSVRPTHEGLLFYERCSQIVGDLRDAEEAVSRFQERPRGRLRVQIPAGFGGDLLVPHLVRFTQEYDKVILDVKLSNLVIDLEPEGFDVIIMTGNFDNLPLIMRKICHIRYVAVASPSYLEQHGVPATIDDLSRHSCLGYYLARINRYREWPLGGSPAESLSGNLNIGNEMALLTAALAGGGIAMVPSYLALDHVDAGRLRVILPKYMSEAQPVSIGYLDRRHLSTRIRAFVDFLVREVPKTPALREFHPFEQVPLKYG